MSDNAQGKKSFVQDFKRVTPKQWIGILVAIVIALVLEVLGFGTQCFGFLIVALVLYMIPHLLGVMSPKVKAVIGIMFIVVAVPVGTVMYADVADDYSNEINVDTSYIKDVEYDHSTGYITAQFTEPGVATVKYGVVDSIAFGAVMVQKMEEPIYFTLDADYNGQAFINLEDGKLYYVVINLDVATGTDPYKSFTIDTGIENGTELSFKGAAYLIAYAMVIFYFILIITTIMRMSAMKARKKMEAQGRLYPQGYGRCKNCGAMVLPGEINCRKCGTYIDVPEEMRAKKKDYFVCESCGAEVPADAKVCARCGVSFDTVEAEVTHVDGTVDTSTETFECSECGAEVPVNAKRCPKCGAEFEE